MKMNRDGRYTSRIPTNPALATYRVKDNATRALLRPSRMSRDTRAPLDWLRWLVAFVVDHRKVKWRNENLKKKKVHQRVLWWRRLRLYMQARDTAAKYSRVAEALEEDV